MHADLLGVFAPPPRTGGAAHESRAQPSEAEQISAQYIIDSFTAEIAFTPSRHMYAGGTSNQNS
jgi:hypothetical protein